MAGKALTSAQLHALFDILTHYETYSEIEGFKYPDATPNYGFPFVRPDGSHAEESSSPLLQRLVTTFVLPFPGVSNLPATFWNVNVQGILAKFALANLSESFDKGAMGTRKTLATVSSSAIEVVVRGVLGGCPRHVRIGGCLRQNQYDLANAHSLVKAWDDVLQELVYGNLIDELFDFVQTEQNLEKHSLAVEAAVEYIIFHLATILHQIFAISPEGQYIMKLVENLHKLLPYSMMRQTLRIGNAATMIQGMMKLLLTKISVTSVSNWMGVTANPDDGMNMLQKIVSMILTWDGSDFKKLSDRIKKAKDGPTKEHLTAIEEHVMLSRSEQDAMRLTCIEKQQSIIMAIFDAADPGMAASLNEETHTACLEYYSARLSARDRDEIAKVCCRQSPDLPTQAIRDGVAAFDPIIREIHSKVAIHEHLSDVETFISELVDTSRIVVKKGSQKAKVPQVSDFVELLQRNRHALYKWLGRLARDCPEIRDDFRTWAKESIKHFRKPHAEDLVNTAQAKVDSDDSVSNGEAQEAQAWAADAMKELKLKDAKRKAELGKEYVQHSSSGGAGAMGEAILIMFASLPEDTRKELVPLLDRHAAYLDFLQRRSVSDMQTLIDDLKSSETQPPDESGGSGRNSGTATPSDSGNGNGNDASAVVMGPGVYLVRWQDLLDETPMTSAKPEGPPRRGRDVKGQVTLGKTAGGGKVRTRETMGLGIDVITEPSRSRSTTPIMIQKQDEEREAEAPLVPDVKPVVEALGPRFKELLMKATETPCTNNSINTREDDVS